MRIADRDAGPLSQYETRHDMKNRKAKEWAGRLALQAAVVIAGGLIVFGGSALGGRIGVRTEAELSVLPAAAAHGIGREPAAARYLGSARAEGAVSLPAYDEYVEGEGPAPEWYRPDEPMAAVWIADVADINVGNKFAEDTDVPCNRCVINTLDFPRFTIILQPLFRIGITSCSCFSIPITRCAITHFKRPVKAIPGTLIFAINIPVIWLCTDFYWCSSNLKHQPNPFSVCGLI